MEDGFGDGRGEASILISHTHWDHVQGLPFFSPLYRAGNRIQIFARQRDTHLEAVFSQQHGAPYFPVPLSAMQAEMSFHALVEGASFELGRARITSTRLNHPWTAMAYRIDVDRAAVVYCSDTAPFTDLLLGREFMVDPPALDRPLPPDVATELARMRAAVVALAAGADLLIYDTQFTRDEYRLRPHWGHSHPDDALAIARDAGVQPAVPVPPRAAAQRRRQRRDPRRLARRRRRRRRSVRGAERVRGPGADPGGRLSDDGEATMKIRFWGVRGSIPAPGPDTIRYGGNTACVSVHGRSGGLVIIDMGTGLMHLGNALMAGAFGAGTGAATILLSHAHWDHIQGLGFFAPVFVPGNTFTVWGPGGSSDVLEEILEGQMDPNFSPLQTLKNFSARFDVRAIELGAPLSSRRALASPRASTPHGATTALAFRITEPGNPGPATRGARCARPQLRLRLRRRPARPPPAPTPTRSRSTAAPTSCSTTRPTGPPTRPPAATAGSRPTRTPPPRPSPPAPGAWSPSTTTRTTATTTSTSWSPAAAARSTTAAAPRSSCAPPARATSWRSNSI